MKKATTACHAVQDAGKMSGYRAFLRKEFLSIKDDTCHFERLPLGALCVLIFLLLVRSPGGLETDSPWALLFAHPFFSPLLMLLGLRALQQLCGHLWVPRQLCGWQCRGCAWLPSEHTVVTSLRGRHSRQRCPQHLCVNQCPACDGQH